MPHMRIREAAGYMGVSDDTVRRWIEHGALAATRDSVGRKVIDGSELAQLARRQAAPAPNPLRVGSSPRNLLAVLLPDIRIVTVMAQVDLQCGPCRVVSLMSSDAVE